MRHLRMVGSSLIAGLLATCFALLVARQVASREDGPIAFIATHDR